MKIRRSVYEKFRQKRTETNRGNRGHTVSGTQDKRSGVWTFLRSNILIRAPNRVDAVGRRATRARFYRRHFHLPSKHNDPKHASRRRIFRATMEVDTDSGQSSIHHVLLLGECIYLKKKKISQKNKMNIFSWSRLSCTCMMYYACSCSCWVSGVITRGWYTGNRSPSWYFRPWT